MKKFLTVLLILLLVIVVALGGLLGFLTVTEYRPADVESVTVRRVDGAGTAPIPSDGFTVLTQSDAAFCTLGQTDFNTSFYQTTTTGKPINTVMLGDHVARTYNNVTYTVMSNTKHPEACMKFLNLWISDPEVGTLISYGIEGKHYVLDENGLGRYPDGQDANSCAYHMGSNLSNINRITWNTENPEYAALGFSFNPENVTNEITQLDNVRAKYQTGLETGTMDPETMLPEFIAALKAAGIEKVIAEKQAQLDAFLGK